MSLNCALATHLAADMLTEAHALLPALQLMPNGATFKVLLGTALRLGRMDMAQRAWDALLAAMLQPDIDMVNMRLRMLCDQVRPLQLQGASVLGSSCPEVQPGAAAHPVFCCHVTLCA